jgi:Rad52/22 family double-strand break repair protein
MENRQLLEQPFSLEQIKQRKGHMGGMLDYVETASVIQRLNEAWDGNWCFEVLEYKILDDEVIVLGKLTADTITKVQFGQSDIHRPKGSNKPLSIGDDLKAAASDAIKKCATLCGVALHLYRDEPPAVTTMPAATSNGKANPGLHEAEGGEVNGNSRIPQPKRGSTEAMRSTLLGAIDLELFTHMPEGGLKWLPGRKAIAERAFSTGKWLEIKQQPISALQIGYTRLQQCLIAEKMADAEPLEEEPQDEPQAAVSPPGEAITPEGPDKGEPKKMQPEPKEMASAVPFPPSSSAADDEAKAKAVLKREALGWGMPEKDINDLMQRYSLETARNLLWQGAQARRKASTSQKQTALA